MVRRIRGNRKMGCANRNHYYMKIKIEMDEKWPIFTMLDPNELEELRPIERCFAQDEFVEIPDDIARKFMHIQKEYLKMQAALEEIYDNAQNNDEIEASQNSLWNNLSENSSGIY